jgi:hypothetical protein
VSCTGASDCTASGETGGGSGYYGVPFVVSETGGTWGNAEQLSATFSTDHTVISCPDATGCTVVAAPGTAVPGMFTFDEANGVWGQPQQISMPSSEKDIVNNPVLSCRSAGNCVILGNMDIQVGTSTSTVPFAATETSSGTWGAAATLPGTPASEGGLLQGLSCVPGGDCTIAVAAGGASGTPYIYTAVSSADGSIGSAQEVYQAPGSNVIYGLSCPQNGYCTLGVMLDYKYIVGTEATASTVTLTASAPTVTYGKEQAETLTATVTSPAGGTPTGTVTVTDGTVTACSITLANGTGKCTLAATALPGGTDQLTATYSGDISYAAAGSTTTITVAKATYTGTIRLYLIGLCLDDRNNSSSNGAVVQVWRCNGLASQQWQVWTDGTIRHNGLCLDAKGYGTANGTKVQLWACTGGANQKWDTRGYRIHYDNPKATGKVLDDTGYGVNGTQQQIWTNNGTINQVWATS